MLIRSENSLESFFAEVHPSVPLFESTIFLLDYDRNRLDSSLFETVAAVSLVILQPRGEFPIGNAAFFLEQQLSSTERGYAVDPGASPLSKMQHACLLAYYSFHRYADRKSWFRIGELTRKAYALGLHQVDNPQPSLTFDSRGTNGDAECWRRVWWVIYCLDSYSNAAASTPFIVELESIRTAVKDVQSSGATCPGDSRSSEAIYLSSDPESLWITAQQLSRHYPADYFALHVVVTTLVRAAANLYRLEIQNPTERLLRNTAALGDVIAAVRLALPPYYMTPYRIALDGSSPTKRHGRLVNVLLLHTAQLLMALSKMLRNTAIADPMSMWHPVLEACDAIVSVFRSLDQQTLTIVDPALCFNAGLVLGLQELFTKCQIEHTSNFSLNEELARHLQILVLFLEQFAAHWYLPRYILGTLMTTEQVCASYSAAKPPILVSHEYFSRHIPLNITQLEVQRLLRMYHGLLHLRWLQHASEMNRAIDQTDTDGLFDLSWLGTMDFSDWNGMGNLFESVDTYNTTAV